MRWGVDAKWCSTRSAARSTRLSLVVYVLIFLRELQEVLCMHNSIRFRVLALLFCGIALAAAYNKTKTEGMMLDAASRFLDSLTPEQRAGTLLDFNGKDRTMWHYYPE